MNDEFKILPDDSQRTAVILARAQAGLLGRHPDKFIKSIGGRDSSCKIYFLAYLLGKKGKMTVWNARTLLKENFAHRFFASLSFCDLQTDLESEIISSILEAEEKTEEDSHREAVYEADPVKNKFTFHLAAALRSLTLSPSFPRFAS